MTEVTFADGWHFGEHLLYDRHEVLTDVICGHGVRAVEVDCGGIIFCEQVPEVGECVLRAEHSPDTVAVEFVVAIELMLLHVGKLSNKFRGDLKLLTTIFAR